MLLLQMMIDFMQQFYTVKWDNTALDTSTSKIKHINPWNNSTHLQWMLPECHHTHSICTTLLGTNSVAIAPRDCTLDTLVCSHTMCVYAYPD